MIRRLHRQLAQELVARISLSADSPASVSRTRRSRRLKGGADSSMWSESGCRPPTEASTVQAFMDLALPRFVGLGDGPHQVHPPWSIASDSPASPATYRLDTSGEEDVRLTVDPMSVSSACLLNLDMLSSSDDDSRDVEVLTPVNSDQVILDGDLPEESVPMDKRQVVRRRASPPDVQIVEAAQVGRACQRHVGKAHAGKGVQSYLPSSAHIRYDSCVYFRSGCDVRTATGGQFRSSSIYDHRHK